MASRLAVTRKFMRRRPRRSFTLRTVTVSLSNSQQLDLGPNITLLVQKLLGLDQRDAGAITMEVLGRLTPAQSYCETVVAQVLGEEVAFYQADPIAYEARVQATSYSIPSMKPKPPGDNGRLPPEIEKVFLDELPQSDRWEEWSEFALDMDGSDIARQLSVDLTELFDVAVERFRRQGSWKGGYLDLRLILFHAAWQMRIGGLSRRGGSERGQALGDSRSFAVYLVESHLLVLDL
jgi:hypothetical protein